VRKFGGVERFAPFGLSVVDGQEDPSEEEVDENYGGDDRRK